MIKLFNKTIKKEGVDYFLVAEIGTNHYEYADLMGISPYEAAIAIIRQAAAGGADAVKFQAYKAEELASEIFAENQYKYMRRRDSLDKSDYIKLIKEGRRIGLDVFYTFFDLQMLIDIAPKVNIIKVASPDITNYPLLEAINAFKKPVIISTAGSKPYEIGRALSILKSCNVVIMHCRAIYPTPVEQLDLGMIRTLNKTFSNNVIGFSSHNPDVGYALPALALGANVLEYHFKPEGTKIKGGDYPVSITKKGLIRIRELFTEYQGSYGNDEYREIPKEQPLRENGRRGLYANRRLAEGERISIHDFMFLRPAVINGYDVVKTDQISLLNNKKMKRSILKGTPLDVTDLEIISD